MHHGLMGGWTPLVIPDLFKAILNIYLPLCYENVGPYHALIGNPPEMTDDYRLTCYAKAPVESSNFSRAKER